MLRFVCVCVWFFFLLFLSLLLLFSSSSSSSSSSSFFFFFFFVFFGTGQHSTELTWPRQRALFGICSGNSTQTVLEPNLRCESAWHVPVCLGTADGREGGKMLVLRVHVFFACVMCGVGVTCRKRRSTRVFNRQLSTMHTKPSNRRCSALSIWCVERVCVFVFVCICM